MAAILAALIYDVAFGALTVATNGESLPPSRILEKGAAFAVGTYHLTITASNGVLPNATPSFTLTVATPRGAPCQQLHRHV